MMLRTKAHNGFVTTELTIGVLIMSLLFSAYLMTANSDNLDKVAYATGNRVGQVNNAIRSFIASDPAGITAGTYKNLNWLKSTVCKDSKGNSIGTASQSFLPCDFPDILSLGLGYKTVVSKSGSEIRAVTDLGIPKNGNKIVPYLSGQVALGANGASNFLQFPADNTYGLAKDDTTGNIQMVASNSESDIYLRVDGSVQPTGDFDWGNRDITNIKDLSVNNTITAKEIAASEKIKGQAFYDQDDSTFYVDPAGESKMLDININSALIRKIVTIGTPCNKKGLLAQETGGFIANCDGTKWVGVPSNPNLTFFSSGNRTLGNHKYCYISRMGNAEDSHYCQVFKSGSTWYKREHKTGCYAVCVN